MATNIFISCKESRIENNRSFYGCFTLGPFNAGQSLTIANALRRTLLSECPGLGIVSVTIENVSHEYSTLPGMRESVLDVLLNLKEIVLKKRKNTSFYLRPRKDVGQNTINQNISSLALSYQDQTSFSDSFSPKEFEEQKQKKNSLNKEKKSTIYSQVGSSFFKPVSGFLKVKGPGVIRAKDLKLPPFIECVDPEQYIATLAEDGVLCMKFIIMEGKGYFIQKQNSYIDDTVLKNRIDFLNQLSHAYSSTSLALDARKNDSLVPFSLNQELSQSKASTLASLLSSFETRNSQKENELKDALSFGTRQRLPQSVLGEKKGNTSAQLKKKATFAGFAKNKDFNVLEEKLEDQKKTTMMEKSSNTLNLDTIFNPVTKISYMIEDFDNKITTDSNQNLNFIDDVCSLIESSHYLKQSFPTLSNSLFSSEFNSFAGESENNSYQVKKSNEVVNKTQNILKLVESYTTSDIKKLSSSLQPLKKESPLHTIVFEIWTNGSLHPREALSIAIQNLASTFLTMQKKKIYSSLYTKEASYLCLPLASIAFARAKNNNLKKVNDNPIQIGQKQMSQDKPSLQQRSKTSSAVVNTKAGSVKEKYLTDVNSFTDKKEQKVEQENNSISFEKSRIKQGIEFLNLPLRPYTILKRLNINTISDLCNLTLDELELIFSNYVNKQLSSERKVQQGINKKYVILIVNVLKKNHFSLKKN